MNNEVAPRDYHAIITKPFFMGIYEVTVAQFRAFVKDTGYRTSAENQPDGGAGHLMHRAIPAHQV